MSQPTQDVSAAILDILIQAGNRKLSKEQSEELSKILKDNFGDDVSVDVTRSGTKILSELRPTLLENIGKMAENFQQQATNAVESLGDEVSKETMLTLWPKLAGAQKFIIVLLALATVVVTGFLAYDTHQNFPKDSMEVLFVSLLPLFGLVVFATWPIKTLAYKSLEIATKVVEKKLEKSGQVVAKTETKTTK
ncbi:TPA: hypothetical protein ACIWNT_000036 [Salmonella enterica subsp. enterica serovar Enteritidis]|uniref:hypothetical protein n=1 Tax=Escherichia coli TaxID=562 RepID=UPI00127A65A7|nr:hypothetical protein [Salmonella enterica subsp. enterica serovar Agona]ECM9354978.1 hypothetical protein [Salmonella enterica subsp. enterica serovar Enteritidis]EEA1788179.1 hypothetical protein [Salmonella enterica subsp. enterica serovar Enteritidis]EIP0083219.1 hypothetical protein [Salmonella enterica subsp. enterica serovar Ridge]DAH66116.1 MAG TPA: hypothetical protein [Caudoviricetes sp.]